MRSRDVGSVGRGRLARAVREPPILELIGLWPGEPSIASPAARFPVPGAQGWPPTGCGQTQNAPGSILQPASAPRWTLRVSVNRPVGRVARRTSNPRSPTGTHPETTRPRAAGSAIELAAVSHWMRSIPDCPLIGTEDTSHVRLL